jgi:hypothetical protein
MLKYFDFLVCWGSGSENGKHKKGKHWKLGNDVTRIWDSFTPTPNLIKHSKKEDLVAFSAF